MTFLIGTVELLGLLAQQMSCQDPFWNWVQGIDISMLGFVIVALFLATWVIALVIWRVGRIEEKWNAGLRTPPVAEAD